MMLKATRRLALLTAAGLVVCFAGPVPAATAASERAAASKSETATPGKSIRRGARHWKRYAHRKYTRVASSSESRKASEKDTVGAGDGGPARMTASVANANALMTATDAPADSAEAMTAKANTVLLAAADRPADAQAPADAAVVASDQLNDVDRALQETPARQTVAMASAKAAGTPPVQAAADDSTSWDQASLIGKIFIAFGALLTMASAARMFMA